MNKNYKKDKIISLTLSILIHGFFLFILIIIKLENTSESKSPYLILNFSEYKQEESKPLIKTEEEIEKPSIPIKHAKKEGINKKSNEESEKTEIDTISNKKRIKVTGTVQLDTIYHNLNFAATLLDSFLVRHPEYSHYILQQQAKELVENKNIKKFSRLALEEKINEELDKYLKENYPEGSEHAMNPNGGPGMQIPIDGLIDAIKKIFN